jgi:hypothetical protein
MEVFLGWALYTNITSDLASDKYVVKLPFHNNRNKLEI